MSLKQLVTTISIISLLHSSTIIIAQELPSNGGFQPIVDGVKNIIGQYYNTKINTNQNTATANKMNQGMKSLDAKIISAQFFPQCKMPESISNFPEGACETPPENDTEAEYFDAYKKISLKHIDLYDKMLNEAQQNNAPIGIQCLDQNKAAIESEFQDKINILKGLKSNIEIENDAFKADAAKLKEEMRGLHNFLHGKKGTDKGDDDKFNISAFFNDHACSAVLKDTDLTQGKGLISVRDDALKGSKMVDSANNLIRNKKNLENQLTEQLRRLTKRINLDGITALKKNINISAELTRGRLNKFSAVDELIKSKTSDFLNQYNSKKTEIEADLTSIKYKVPSLNNNFRTKISKFTNGSYDFFRKKIINNCVRRTGDIMLVDGLGISDNDALKGIDQRSTTSETTENRYRKDLQMILGRNTFIQDELKEIKQLDMSYGIGDITIPLESGSSRKHVTPYAMYQSSINKCTVQFNLGKLFSKDDPNGSSFKEKTENAAKLIQDLERDERNFANELVSDIQESVLYCSGNNSSSLAGSCNNGLMQPDGNTFCLKASIDCAKNVQQCYIKADSLIKTYTNNLNRVADRYNTGVNNLVEKQKDLLNKKIGEVLTESEWFKTYFKHSKYVLPDKLLIDTPVIQDSNEFNIKLLGGDNLALLNSDDPKSLPSQIDKLITMLNNQKVEVTNTIFSYREKIEAQVRTQRSRWETLSDNCRNHYNNYRESQLQALDDFYTVQAEEDKQTSIICNTYDTLLASSIIPGCDSDDGASALSEEIAEVNHRINPEVSKNIASYKYLCNMANNEIEYGTEIEENDLPLILQLCNEHDNWKGVMSHLNSEYDNNNSTTNLLDNLRKDYDYDKNDHIKQFEELKDELDGGPKKVTCSQANKILNDAIDNLAQGHQKYKDANDKEKAGSRIVAITEIEKLQKITKKDNCNDTNISELSSALHTLKTKDTLDNDVTDLIEKQTSTLITKLNAMESTKEKNQLAVKNLNKIIKNKNDKQFKGEKSDICAQIQNERTAEAINECSEKNYSKTCIKKKLKNSRNSVPSGFADYEIAIRKLKRAYDIGLKDLYKDAWDEIGANRTQPCDSKQNNNIRQQTSDPILLENQRIDSMTRTKGI